MTVAVPRSSLAVQEPVELPAVRAGATVSGRRVLIVQQRLTTYRLPLFETLRETLKRRGIGLTVAYGEARDEEQLRGDAAALAWGTPVTSRCIRLWGRPVVHLGIPAELWAAHSLWVLPHENSLPLVFRRLLFRRSDAHKVALWGHGTNFADRNPRSPGNRLRAWTAVRPDWWFAYTGRSAGRILASGYPEERITTLDNAIDTRSLAADCAAAGPSRLRHLRERLGFVGKSVGVFLGSLHQAKRMDFLFAAADELQGMMPDFALIVVGDGPLREKVADFARTRPWCRWVGHLQGQRKAEHLALGSLLLNPGMVGLCILDGFACGLPLVTTDCGTHSPEIDYLDHGRNGLMTADTQPAFVAAVLDVLADRGRLAGMAAACRSDARRYTIERSAQNFAAGIVRALAATPWRTSAIRRASAARGRKQP